MAKDKSSTNILAIIFKILYYLVTIFVCLIVLFLLYYIISSQLHADDEEYKSFVSIYTIVSPSMTPVINVYDVVVNVKVTDPTSIQPGDIITYKSAAANSEGMTITHRVIEVAKLPDGTYEYMTQGDNNKEPDSIYVTFDTVIGKEIMIIPFIGRIQFLIATQKGWLILLLVPVLIYLLKEIFKLIDLFNLRKRVDKVVGTTEENFIEKRKLERIANEERKEKIRKELAAKEHKINALERNPKEPENFLERYTETLVNVKENKYTKIIKPSKEIDNEISPSKTFTKNETTNVIKPKKTISTEKIEILDTDELTTKIKEYDDKLSELNKILKKVEKTKNENTPVIEKDDYLEGNRIKVVSMVPAKSFKGEKKIRLGFESVQTEIDRNSKTKVARPISEDISTIRNQKKPNKVKPSSTKLNLNPKSVKKVNRPNKKVQEKPKTIKQKQLNLNPTKVKKVNRPNKQKKQPLIVIEKVSKSRSR